MSFLPKLAKSGLFGLTGLLLGGGKKKPRPALPQFPSRDDVLADVEANDALRRRRGAGADIITGVRGMEAAPSSLGRLVVGN